MLSMRCSNCSAATHVLDTRTAGAHAVRRRRECLACGKRFTTVERDMVATEIEDAVIAYVRSLDTDTTEEVATYG